MTHSVRGLSRFSMRLKYQLFLTLLTASALLIALMFLVSSWSFSRGFLDYQNRSVAARLSEVADDLATRYAAEGNWDWADRRTIQNPFANPPGEGLRGERSRRERPRGDRPGKKPNKPRGNESGSDRSGDPPPEGRPPEGRPNGKPGLRLILIDENGGLLVGRLPERSDEIVIWKTIELDGEVLGKLGIRRMQRINATLDQAFERQQKKSFLYAALAMIVLSGLLSIPLAARIVKPLLSVKQAVGEISRGNFTHRVKIQRKDELGDLARDINDLGYTLEQNRDSRQRWVAEISHELRTPLSVLHGEIEALQDGLREFNEQSIESLHTEVLQLGNLVDDLHTLSMSDVGALDYQMTTLSLAALVEEHIHLQSGLLEHGSIEVVSNLQEQSTDINGDSKRLRQLLTNLTNNTIKYTDADARLQIDVASEMTENGRRVILSWSDSSPGVETEALDMLFDPLFRTETSRSRQHGGAGLGLAIVKRIVEAHQGEITAKHSVLGGLCIRVEFPAYNDSR